MIVTSPPAGRVTVISTRTRRVSSVFRGFGYPHDVETSGRYAYVTDEARCQVAVLDLARDRVAARVPVAPRPHDLAVGDAAWVTHTTSSSSLRRDGHPPRRGRLPLGGSPLGDGPRGRGRTRHGARGRLWSIRAGRGLHGVALVRR